MARLQNLPAGLCQGDGRGRVDILAGLIAVLLGVLGVYRVSAARRRSVLPAAAHSAMALLGVVLVFCGLELLLGSPAGLAIVPVLIVRRGLAIYNAHLLRGAVRAADLWPAAGDLALGALAVAGTV
ncbi:MAG TPA: hypothetical protein VFD32_11440 [Dehalococcoidia bacterium]|nr:hypothetical protein [Dehalococcoidia bacterium]